MADSYQKRTADREKIISVAKERFKKAEEYWADAHKAYVDDLKFLAGEQWPKEVKTARGNRPTLVVDKLNQYRRQVTNDIRQNRPQSKAIPMGGGDEDVAEAFTGLIRSIWSKSNGDEATDWAADCAVSGGLGFIRVLTEYVSEGSFDQEPVIARIRNPLSVLLDPDFQRADASDARYGFIVDEMPVETFKHQFPDAKQTDWDSSKYSDGWGSKEKIRVCEYFYKVDEKRNMLMLADGSVITREAYDTAAMEGTEPPMPIVREEVRPVTRVKWCRMTGAEVLEDRDWLGKYIPLAIVIGEERDIDGKVTLCSLIRPAKDAQRLHNYSRSAFAERVALTPKAPWVAAAGQVEDYAEWKTANTGAHSVLRYEPIEINGSALPPPQRVSAADIPAGFAEDAAMSEHDIQAALGMYSASVGEKSNEKSGRAIMARQREGDTATFHFQDNLNRAVRYVGRILVDLIPKVMDSRRVVRLLSEDGTSRVASIDPDQLEPMADIGGKKIYNLSAGEYDIEIISGPSFTTKRQESAEAMIEMTRANPQAWMTHGDLIAKSQDWPGAEDFAKRSKAVMPPELKMAIAEDDDGEENPEVKAVMGAAQQAIGQREQQIQQMGQAMEQMQRDLQGAQMDAKAAKDRNEVEMVKAQIAMFQAQTERLRAEAEANAPQGDNGALDAVRLQYEDKWKQLEADTKILIAQLQSKTSLMTASMTPGESEVGEDGAIKKKPGIEAVIEAVNANLAQLMALQQDGNARLTATIAETMNRPKSVLRDDVGRVIGVQ